LVAPSGLLVRQSRDLSDDGGSRVIASIAMPGRPAGSLVLRAVAGLGLWLATACAPGTAREQTAQLPLRVITGLSGGGYHALSHALAKAYATVLPQLDIRILEGSGALSTVMAIERGDADLGFTLADVAYMASIGQLDERPSPSTNLRGVSLLQLSSLHLVVGPHTDLKRVADLRHRSVAVGPPGAGAGIIAKIVLTAFGIEPQSIRAETLPNSEAARRLIGGTLDAMFVSSTYPAEAVTEATNAGARLVSLEGPAIELVRQTYPFLKPSLIPGRIYRGHANALRTVGVDALLVCRRDLDETLVYELTRHFFEQLSSLSAEFESLLSLDLAQLPATPIPLHAGAARYYRERELYR
jgi:TRAP transporter TAXI family solute receptor